MIDLIPGTWSQVTAFVLIGGVIAGVWYLARPRR